MNLRMSIAMLGTRGLPATFGGVEHHVESIGKRLVERGHSVTVFSQAKYMGELSIDEHLGMRVVRVPSVDSKHLEAIVHSMRSTARAMKGAFDVIHYHAVGPGVMSPLPRYFSRKAVVQTIHGLDADRAKWGGAAQWLLNRATWMSARVPDATVTVSRAIAEHYRTRYRRECFYIPNGVEPRPRKSPGALLQKLGTSQGEYLIFVGRLVPEKNPDLLIRAFGEVSTNKRLIVVGGSSYTDDYFEELRTLAARDDRVVMPGYLYGDDLDELFTNAAAFVLPSSLEGLPLTLLEAIESGLPVIASDIDPHVEVLGAGTSGGRLFPSNSQAALTETIEQVLSDIPSERKGASSLREATLAVYDWERAVDALEGVYQSAMGR